MKRLRSDVLADQLRARIFSGLHLGTLRPGQRLWSVRELAREFAVDPRVALAAYEPLAAERLVEMRTRSGVFLALRPPRGDERLPRNADWLIDCLVQGLSRGVGPSEFPAWVRRGLSARHIRTVCIECNDDQIHGLCTELRADYGLHTQGVDVADIRSPARLPPVVQAADLLVTTSFHAREVARVRRTGPPAVVVSLRPGFLADLAAVLEREPVYFLCIDPRFAAKLRRIFGDLKNAANLRPIVLGRDDVSRIEPGAAAYVMSSAEPHTPRGLRVRLIRTPRVFSLDTARDLLQFIVAANLRALGSE